MSSNCFFPQVLTILPNYFAKIPKFFCSKSEEKNFYRIFSIFSSKCFSGHVEYCFQNPAKNISLKVLREMFCSQVSGLPEVSQGFSGQQNAVLTILLTQQPNKTLKFKIFQKKCWNMSYGRVEIGFENKIFFFNFVHSVLTTRVIAPLGAYVYLENFSLFILQPFLTHRRRKMWQCCCACCCVSNQNYMCSISSSTNSLLFETS